MNLAVSSNLLRQYAVVGIASLNIFTSGMSFAWPSPILVKLFDPEQTPLSRPITDNEGSWIVSVGFLCATFTCYFIGMLLDIVGRKNCVLLLFIPKLLAGLLFIFATEVWMLILGRAFITASDCYTLIIVPVYASDLASKDHRSVLVTLLPVFANLGELITYAVGPFVSYQTFNILFTCIIALTLIPTIFFLPESPSFLYSKGHQEEALKVLVYLRGDFQKAREEIEEYKLLSNKPKEKISKMTFLRDRIFLKSLALASLIAVGIQLIGFNAVTFYLQTILISANTSLSPQNSSVIIGIIQLGSSFFTHAVISSRIKRKSILTVSLSMMCIGMTGLGVFFKISQPEDYVITGVMNYLPLICLIVTIASYKAGIGSLLWLVVGELFTDSARAFGVSLALTGAMSLVFLTILYFPFVTSVLGPSTTYWIFSSMIVLLITLIVIFLPETNGKSYKEIQMALGRKFEDDIEKKEEI